MKWKRFNFNLIYMLTNAILNQCFDILLQGENADEAIAQIAKIFAANEMTGRDTMGDLLKNASTFFLEGDVALGDEEKKAIAVVRNQAVAHFLSIDGGKKYFNQLGDRGRLPIVSMLSNFMFWDKDLILNVIRNTDNIKDYKVPTSFSGDPDPTLLEYFLTQQSFGESTKHAGEVAMALLSRGCDIDFENKKNLQNLSSGRAIESDLTLNLLQYFINRGDPIPLFYLISEADSSCREPAAGSSSRRSSVSSMSSGIISTVSLIEALAKRIITTNLDNSAINSVRAPVRSLYGAISIPCFFLERDTHGDRYPVSKRIWQYIQAKARIEKLTPQIFVHDKFFLHAIVASNNALLLSFAIQKIDQIEVIEDRNQIYQNQKNDISPLELACKLGYDHAIEGLFDKSNNDDIEGGLELCAKEGKAVSLQLLVKKIKDAKKEINMDKALLHAILSHRETITSFLLDNNADLNCRVSIAIDDENVKNISPLEVAILMDNFDLVSGLIERGASYSQDGVDIGAYREYKEKNLDIIDTFVELERNVATNKDRFTQSFGLAVDMVEKCKEYLSPDLLIEVRRKTSQLDSLCYPRDLVLQQELSKSISAILNIDFVARDNKLEMSVPVPAAHSPIVAVSANTSRPLMQEKKECVIL